MDIARTEKFFSIKNVNCSPERSKTHRRCTIRKSPQSALELLQSAPERLYQLALRMPLRVPLRACISYTPVSASGASSCWLLRLVSFLYEVMAL